MNLVANVVTRPLQYELPLFCYNLLSKQVDLKFKITLIFYLITQIDFETKVVKKFMKV